MSYDPTKVGGGAMLLPEGEWKCRVTETGDYVADSGNRVMKLQLTGEHEGQEVRRTYRITLGLSWSPDAVAALVDACGGDPLSEKIASYLHHREYHHSHFADKTLSVMIRHKNFEGRVIDEIAHPIPGFYRAQWEEARRQGTGNGGQGTGPADSAAGETTETPF